MSKHTHARVQRAHMSILVQTLVSLLGFRINCSQRGNQCVKWLDVAGDGFLFRHSLGGLNFQPPTGIPSTVRQSRLTLLHPPQP